MPNWCTYRITIKGDRKTIQNIHAKIRVPEDEQVESPTAMGEYDLTRILPIPDELLISNRIVPEDSPEYPEWKTKTEANSAKYGYSDWYWWCLKNWGTKWAPSISSYEIECDDANDAGVIVMSGLSAWSAPDRLVSNLTEMFPVNVVISYDEGGLGFGGAEGYVNGQCVHNGYFDYNDIPEIEQVMSAEQDREADEADEYWEQWWESAQEAVEAEIGRQEVLAYKELGWMPA